MCFKLLHHSNLFKRKQCGNPFCEYCCGSSHLKWKCTGPSDEPEERDYRSCDNIMEQSKPIIGFRCKFKKRLSYLLVGRNFNRIRILRELPWKIAMQEFSLSYPSLVNDVDIFKGPHEFAWCLWAIDTYLSLQR